MIAKLATRQQGAAEPRLASAGVGLVTERHFHFNTIGGA
jgi:hypothetical protein